jgi:hypothetical protein
VACQAGAICAWGCNIFSCVDCSDEQHSVHLFEDFDVHRQGYTIEQFFEMWMKGEDLLSHQIDESETVEIINPFTRKKTRVTKRRRKGKK